MNRSLKIPLIAHASLAHMVRHWTPKPVIISCIRSNPTGGNFFFDVVKSFEYNNAISAKFCTNCEKLEYQYCQLRFSFAIRDKLDKWNLQPRNLMILRQLISNFILFTDIVLCKYGRKLQINGNDMLARMPILPIWCVYEKPEFLLFTFTLLCLTEDNFNDKY